MRKNKTVKRQKGTRIHPQATSNTCEKCERDFKNQGGLRIHIKRIHKEVRVIFACNKCGAIFKSENSEKNHRKTCEGDRYNENGTKTSGRCDRTLQARNIARHKRQNCKGNRVPEKEATDQHNQHGVYK